jgi:hypothetical protein
MSALIDARDSLQALPKLPSWDFCLRLRGEVRV